MATNPAPTPDDVDIGRPAENAEPNVHNPAPQPFDEQIDAPTGDVDWTHRREIFVLPNGSTLIAHNEIESSAYQNKGAKLVDVIQDQ